MEASKKKYKPMENVLFFINSKAIALQDKEKKRNNKILEQVTTAVINLMKQKDLLFGVMYERNFYGGSYYDNLKVGNPNEYDLDLVLNLPVISEPCVRCSDQHGFVQVEIKQFFKILSRPEIERRRFEKMYTLMESGNYLSTTKVLKWMERVISLAFNEMPKDGGETYVDVTLDKPDEVIRILVKMSKGAPAFTMKLSGTDIDGSDIQLDIDLVPCFQFNDKNNWPDESGGYRPNPSTIRSKFLVVPKKPKGEEIEQSPILERYWRLSFQEQERELIGQNLKTLKPSLRLLKKLRDKHNHKIASYFIKTIFLWTLEEEEPTFWAQSLSIVFMTMLKKYAERVRQNDIPYYWNKNFNLIGYLKDSTKNDVANTLQRIIAEVERNLNDTIMDPFIIGKYLLPQADFERLREEATLGKKFERSISIATSSTILNKSAVDTTDSKSNDPPLSKLGFDPTLINIHRQYSDTFEEKSKRMLDDIMSQINSRSNNSSDGNVLSYLQKIDEKMDQMLEKFDNVLEDNKQMDLRLKCLEEQVRQLRLKNEVSRNRVDETEHVTFITHNSIEAVLNTNQIEDTISLTK